MDYAKQYQEYLVRVNAALETACNTYLPEESDVCRAARYSLLGGGKRIRAVLVLAVCDMLNGDAAAADQFAAAVEMLHCYSLIHDDLPCMDNDDLRRGKPSCHKAFGEATAMLAGDVLLTEAFDVIANVEAPATVNVRAARALGAGAGSRGMVYGQELDLKYEALAATEEQLRLIHRNKTGALINAAVQMGAAAAQANETQCRELEGYAYDIYTSMMNLTKQLIFRSKNMTMKVNLLLVYMLMTFRLEILPKPISIEFLLYYLMIIQYTIIKYMVAVIKIGECLLHYPKLLIARRNVEKIFKFIFLRRRKF